MFVALGGALGLSELEHGSKSCRRVVAVAGLVVAGILAVAGMQAMTRHVGRGISRVALPCIFAAISVLLLAYDAGRVKRRALRALLLAITVCCCALNVTAGYTKLGANYIKQQAKAGIYPRISSETAAPLIDDDSVWRVGHTGCIDSNAVLLDYRGTGFYWSLVDKEMSAYYQHLGLPYQLFSYYIGSLGASAPMNAVAAVKYYDRVGAQDYTVPYGYDKIKTIGMPDGRSAEIFENAYALPLGYAFDAVMEKATYESLPIEGKLQAILRCAVTDVPTDTPVVSFEDGASTLDYTITAIEDVALEPRCIRARAGGRVRLDFAAPEDSEIYVIFEGLQMEDQGDGSYTAFTVNSKNGSNIGTVIQRRSNFYFPKTGCALCAGTSPLGSCDIIFSSAGKYTYNEIRVVALPLSAYRTDVEARRAEGMTDIILTNNRITGRIDVFGDRVLQIAVPYSSGWRAWVDGVERPVFRCGGMYMGLSLETGRHEIEMRYVTPGLFPGATCSLAALLTIIVLSITGSVRRRQMEEK